MEAGSALDRVKHPDLTPAEIAALTAGFRHPAVRRHIMTRRIAMVRSNSAAVADFLSGAVERDTPPVWTSPA